MELLGIPVVTTWPAKDFVSPDHPLNVGSPGAVGARGGNFAVQNCDMLISVGARLDNSVTAYNPGRFARAAKRVVVDVDGPELAKFEGKFEMTVQADAGDFLRLFLSMKDRIRPKNRAGWIARCAGWKKRYPAADGKSDWPTSGVISHFQLMNCLSEEIPENTMIVPGVAGLGVETFFANFRLKPGQRWIFNAGLGNMGHGLPAMIGAAMANGGKPFVGVEGDGSLQMNLQEYDDPAYPQHSPASVRVEQQRLCLDPQHPAQLFQRPLCRNRPRSRSGTARHRCRRKSLRYPRHAHRRRQ